MATFNVGATASHLTQWFSEENFIWQTTCNNRFRYCLLAILKNYFKETHDNLHHLFCNHFNL